MVCCSAGAGEPDEGPFAPVCWAPSSSKRPFHGPCCVAVSPKQAPNRCVGVWCRLVRLVMCEC
eukprot:12625331-Prorocentrum_lima.AAC.1